MVLKQIVKELEVTLADHNLNGGTGIDVILEKLKPKLPPPRNQVLTENTFVENNNNGSNNNSNKQTSKWSTWKQANEWSCSITSSITGHNQ